jgi:hypothetical protein
MVIPPQGFRHAVDLLLKSALRRRPVDAKQLAKELVALGDDMKASPECTEWVIAEFERLVTRPAPEVLHTFGRNRRDDIEPRDLFLVYVPEDRLPIAAPLAVELVKRGVSVAFSEYEVAGRDEMFTAIEQGLARHRAGAVLFTAAFERRPWGREAAGGPRLLILRDTSSAVLVAERLKRTIVNGEI